MRPGSSLGSAVLCWLLVGVTSYNPWGFLRGESDARQRGVDVPLGQSRAVAQASPWAWVDVSQLQAASPLHPVAVQCREAQMVVTVRRDLFGTGRPVRAAELALGPAACRPASAAGSAVTFVAGLHECGSVLRLTPDMLVYSMHLNYNPAPADNSVIVRTSPAVVPIECHYPRRENVSSNAVQPTWVPFHSTLSSEERLAFSLRLMEDDWSFERASSVFQLGELLHFQAGVDAENHAPLRLFVDSCVATPSPDRNSFPQYALIDFSGCLIDGQVDDATSAFISPRPRQDVLQFVVDAFKFTGNFSNLIYITCHLKVSLADQAPNPLNKACSFDKARGLWAPVEGTRDICSCCEVRNCGSRRPHGTFRRQGGRFRRELSPQPDSLKEADVVVGPLLIHSWQDHSVLRMPSQDPKVSFWMVLGLVAVTGLVVLILAALGALTICQKPSNPV